MATVPATEFNRNPSQVKRLAASAPVVITERNRPTLVVLSYEDYTKLVGTPDDLAAWLEMDEEVELDVAETGLGIEPVVHW